MEIELFRKKHNFFIEAFDAHVEFRAAHVISIISLIIF